MGRSAAFFDLDKTVIARSSTLAFGRPFYHGGLMSRRAVLKSTYAQALYLLHGADEKQMGRMRDYLAAQCRGWEVAQVRSIVEETLHDLVDPLVYDEAVTLIEEHRRAGREVVLVSASGEEVVRPIGHLVGADDVIATRMVVEAGRYTGEIAFYAFGPHKAAAVRELADVRGYDLAECWAYSDSATDLPLLDAVGHPYAVNPDRALRRAAAERGWPVLVFARPVALRSRIRRLSSPPVVAVAGAAIGVGAAAIGWRMYAQRRASRRP